MPSFLAVVEWLFFHSVSSAAFCMFAMQSRSLQRREMRFLLHIPVLFLLASFSLMDSSNSSRLWHQAVQEKLRCSVLLMPFLNNYRTSVQKLRLFFICVGTRLWNCGPSSHVMSYVNKTTSVKARLSCLFHEKPRILLNDTKHIFALHSLCCSKFDVFVHSAIWRFKPFTKWLFWFATPFKSALWNCLWNWNLINLECSAAIVAFSYST